VKALRIYIADEGDTLRTIAKKYQVDIETLIYLNTPIASPDLHIAGRQVDLPPLAKPIQNRITDTPYNPLNCPPPWIPLTPLTQMAETEYDILVVGTGAGGGAAIWRLCEQWGRNEKRIGVIEAGDLLIPTHRDNIPTAGFTQAIWSDPEVVVEIGKLLLQFSGAKKLLGLGGRTLVWGTASPRMSASEMSGWPVTAEEMEKYFNIAEEIMNVNRIHSKASAMNEVMLNRLRENGFPEVIPAPAAVDLDPEKVVPSYGSFSSILFLALGLIRKPFDLAVKPVPFKCLLKEGK
jgi:hypothetical protein